MSSTASIANSNFLVRRSIAGSGAGRAEAARAAHRRRQLAHDLPFCAADRRNDELRDALAARDRHRRAAKIGEDDADLAAIIGVDRARAVEDGDAVAEREAG